MKVLDVPDSLAPLAQAISAVASHVLAFQNAGQAGDVVDFPTAERELMALVAALEGACTAQMLKSLDPVAPRVEVDGQIYRRMNNPNAESTYFGLRSAFRVERALYRLQGERNGPTIVPMELRAGIVEGLLTPAAAEGLATLGQTMPSREASETSKRLGVLPYSRSEHFRAAVAVGTRWGELRELYEESLVETMVIPTQATSVSVSVDRASMPMREPRPLTERDIERGIKNPISVNFRMAFCCVLTLYDAQGAPLECIRYAHVPSDGAEDMVSVLRGDLAILLERRPDLRVVALADGAKDMQSILKQATAGHDVVATLVDFWHLLEKLGKACTAVDEDAKVLLPTFRAMLLHSDTGIDRIAAQLAGWDTRYVTEDQDNPLQLPPRPEALHHAMTYLTNNAEQMRYASVYQAGLPIGSGTVEATAKTLFETRMRRPGCRWIESGAQPILALRALATSSTSRWDQAMAHVVGSYTSQITLLGPKGAHVAGEGIH